jgi:replicative DNA helicase
MTAVLESEATYDRRPHDDEAERIVLGAMMMSRQAAEECMELLTTADYYQPVHSRIHAAILGLAAGDEPTDPVAVMVALERDQVRIPEGPLYLHTLMAAVPTAANAGWHARRVAELAVRRRLIEASLRTIQRANTPGVEVETLADEAEAAICAAAMGRTASAAGTPVGDMIDDYVGQLFAGAPPEGVVPTGLPDLDAVLGGFKPGQLIVVGARPGMGKTVVALDFVRHAAEAAHHEAIPSMICTLEMTRQEILGRLVAATCGVSLTAITARRLDVADKGRIQARMDRLRRIPLLVEDTPGMTIGAVRSLARRAAQRHHIGLLAVDYLQLMTASSRGERRDQDVAEISRGLKLLALELHIPVIACSQLNRSADMRADKRPQLSDLRESGSIEQDADVVILLHREDYYDKKSPRSGEIDLIIAKNRSGPEGIVACIAQLSKSRIVSAERPS